MGSLAHIVRVLAHRDFRYLWLAQSFSVVGDFVALVALSLYVIQRTGHPTDLGRNNWTAARERFNEAHGRPLVVRCERNNIRPVIHGFQVLPPTGEDDTLCHAETVRQLPEPLFFFSTAYEHEQNVSCGFSH